MPKSAHTVENRHRSALEEIFREHFSLVRQELDEVCDAHFYSLSAVGKRHWRNRRDIPVDLAALPRAGWELLCKLGRKRPNGTRKPSGKELETITIIANDVLKLPQLEDQLQDYLDAELGRAGILKEELSLLFDQENQYQIEQWIQQKVSVHSITQEGLRESLMFLTVGLVGRAFSDKIVFGSAIGLGAAASSSIYLSHQGWWSTVTSHFFGVPGWVSIAGMAGGFLAMLAIMPVLSPLVETGVNRVRSRRMLMRIIDGVEHDMLDDSKEIAGIVGRMATFIGFLPDLAQLLVRLRG